MQKLSPSALSPTPTTYSSNNLNLDRRQITRVYYKEFAQFLAKNLQQNKPAEQGVATHPNPRSDKLVRLTILQFYELSTDVYDELIRRKNANKVLFLPARDEFHPKRNQARQKLATLPAHRLQDLIGDVHFDIARRFPEFKENPSSLEGVSTSPYCPAVLPSNEVAQPNDPHTPSHASPTRDKSVPATLDIEPKPSQNAVQSKPAQFAGDMVTTAVNRKTPSGVIYRRIHPLQDEI